MTNNGKPAGGWQWERVLHGIVPPLISPLDDASLDWQLRSAWFWSVFGQRQMGAPLMIIIRISGKVMVQRSLAENDHVIQALAADGADSRSRG